jgi:predicted Zn-dependent protease
MRILKVNNKPNTVLKHVFWLFLLLSSAVIAKKSNFDLMKGAQKQQQQLVDKYGLVENDQWTKACHRLIAELSLIEFQHCQVIGADFPNAYSLAHGVVVLTQGLLLNINNDDQLAHILAHEHAHIELGHHQQAMQLVNNPPKLFTKSRIKKFYRNIEIEADQTANDVLLAHHKDPLQIHHYLIRVEKLVKESSNDHQKLKDRIIKVNLPTEVLESKWMDEKG